MNNLFIGKNIYKWNIWDVCCLGGKKFIILLHVSTKAFLVLLVTDLPFGSILCLLMLYRKNVVTLGWFCICPTPPSLWLDSWLRSDSDEQSFTWAWKRRRASPLKTTGKVSWKIMLWWTVPFKYLSMKKLFALHNCIYCS